MRKRHGIPFSPWRKTKGALLILLFTCFYLYVDLYLLEITQRGQIVPAMVLGLMLITLAVTAFWRFRKVFILNMVEENRIEAKLYFRMICSINCRKTVYYEFFQDDYKGIMEQDTYIMLSNERLAANAVESRLDSFNMKKQIVMPYNEAARLALSSWLECENWVLVGDGHPPAEKLEKKEEPPVAKREKSPDDPPPFTGKWNGRF